MRIALVATSRIPSRAANSIRVMKVAQAIVELGHEVRLWLPGPRSEVAAADLERHYGLRQAIEIEWVGSWPPLRRWDFSWHAAMASRRWDPDLWYVWPYQVAAMLSTLGRPTILEVHDRPAGLAGPPLFRLFLRGGGARRLLVITEALRVALEREYRVGLRPPFALLTPSGVDLEPYANLPTPGQARQALGWPEGFTAGYIGQLYPGRGLDLLAELASRNPAIGFIWAGGEPSAVELWRRRLVDTGVANIRLLGFLPQDELPRVAAACEVLLMPYERSIAVSSGGDTAAFASPMKTFEYMAAGRAILASDLPVFREVLNTDNAILLPPESVESWNDALSRIQADPALARRLGASARAQVGRYSWLERTRRALEGIERRPETISG